MKFDDVVAAVRDSLEQEHRIAYRMLKRRFELDDDDIEDLKAELIDAKRLALDEDGKVLVWANGAGAAPQGVSEHPAEADRRLLTVMFCDVVDSTGLSEQFDAEELRDLIRRYQYTCAEVIANYDGHIAQFLGDGLLVYFGYPVAQEDEAYQAVRSALEIIARLRDDPEITAQIGTAMRVRIGIHSGAVVIGEMGGSGRAEHLALGDTPNIAARVQSAARPDEILISESTHRLVEGLFDVEPLGAQDLKGVSHKLDLFRVTGESSAESPFEIALSTGKLTRFVGQVEELALIAQDWTQARNANGQAILLSAEAGMGKSRLAQEFKDRVGDESARLMTIRCSPYHRSSAFYPIIQVIQRVFGFEAADTVEQKLEKITTTLADYSFSVDDATDLIVELLSLGPNDLPGSGASAKHERRERLFRVLIEWFIQESERAPVYAIWDDLHWADPSTLELLEHYLDHLATSATLAVLIYRSNFIPPWKRRGFFRYLSLNRLSDAHIEELINDVADGRTLPVPVIEQIKDKTDGIPLYVEELTRTLVDSGMLDNFSGDDGDITIDQVMIPMTLQDSLEARLDRCPVGKEIAQWGAAIGREFSYSLLQAVVEDRARVKTGINELLDAELIYRSGSPSEPTFIFKHALLRDTAYESLLIRRRRAYHARIAETIEKEFPRIDATQPEVVAYHYTEAGLMDEAIRCWFRAGQYAHGRSAEREALGHLQQGLSLLARLARTPERAQAELDILLLRGAIVISTEGNAADEVERIYQRALTVCEEIGDSADKSPAYFGLRSYYLTNAALSKAHEVSLNLYGAATRSGSTDALIEAHVALANSYHFMGDTNAVITHAGAAAELYDPDAHHGHAEVYGIDPGVFANIRLGVAACWRGAFKEMQQRFDQAQRLAAAREHPFTSAFSFGQMTWAYQWLGEHDTARGLLDRAFDISSTYGFQFQAAASRIIRGTYTIRDSELAAGIAETEQALADIDGIRSHLLFPFFISIYAEALGAANDPERGLAMLPDAIELIQRTGARYAEPNLYCVKGELLRQVSLPLEASRAFERSISLSRERGLLAQELRALVKFMDLDLAGAELHGGAARLREIYEALRGEPELPDLREARNALEAAR